MRGDLERATVDELFARLREPEIPEPPRHQLDDVLDAWAQYLGGRLILAEAEDSGWDLPGDERRRAEAMRDAGELALRKMGAL